MYFTLILKVVFSFESIGFRKQFLWFDIIHCDAPIAAFSGLNNRKNQKIFSDCHESVSILGPCQLHATKEKCLLHLHGINSALYHI